MRRFVKAATASAGALALSLAAGPAGAAGDLVALAHLAPQLGYTYTWVASESAVALTRPGLYVLIRTSNPLYDVNDSVESTSQAPLYRNNDVYVNEALAGRLRTLAERYAAAGPGVRDDVRPPSAMAAPVTSASGALTLTVAPTGTSEAINVSGTGPASVPLTIELSSDIMQDMPRILLSRTHLTTDAAGKFTTVISLAPLHLYHSLVHVTATSLPGVSLAQASLYMGLPNPSIAHPVTELPRDYRPH